MTKDDLVRDIPRFFMDFDVFMKECLGMKEDKDLGRTGLTPTHTGLNRFLQEDKSKTKMVLMPRYSYKSTITTIGHVLWCLIRNPNERVLIYSDSADKAKGFLAGIKAHIEGKAPGSRFRDYFPQWETDPNKGGKWNDSEIVVRTRKYSFPEPSIDTGGIETSKVGKHYDRIYFDDIVSDLNVTTKAQMDKVYECYQKSLSLLKPDGDVMITGTRWAFADPYGRIIENTPEMGKFITAIEKDGVFPFESIGLNKEFLEKKKKSQGSYLVSCLYFNNPISDEDAIFRYEDFKFYDPDQRPEGLYVTCTCDPAGEGEDYTAISVVGTDDKGNLYLLELVNAHLKPNQIVDAIIRLSYRWKFRVLGVEDNFFRGLLEKEIKIATEEERKNKHFTPFSFETFTASAKRGEGKNHRIMALQPFHERGSLLFPSKEKRVESLNGAWGELANQMLQYTVNHRPQHDDALDALAYQIKLMKTGMKDTTVRYPRGSIAEILKQDWDRQNQLHKRLPLKYRPSIQPFFLEV